MNSADPYAQAGVRNPGESLGFRALLHLARESFSLRTGVGRPVLDLGAYANVLDIGGNIGIAVSTDGVGTKLLIAQAMERYDTVGIDCVAMNVNDVLAVGAEPLALLDYIAVEAMDDRLLEQLAKGLYEGAKQANCSIPGGELAQVKELLHSSRGRGFDLIGTAVGIVPLDKIIVGQHIEAGDVVYGLPSSGLHSNGYTLARRVLLEQARLKLHERIPELGRTLGEELLEPTRIYVQPVVEMLRLNLRIKALLHITGDGLLNLPRVQANMGFILDNLPPPPPIFALIERCGQLSPADMYRVFNMGIGYVLVAAAADGSDLESVARRHGLQLYRLGVAVADETKTVALPQHGLVSRGDAFAPA